MPVIANMMGPSLSRVMVPPGLHAANLTAVTAMTTGVSYFLYVGRSPSALASLTFACNVVTAGATITWAEVAVFKGLPVVQGNASLTRLGFASVATVFNSAGRKNVAITLSGVATGDDLWLAFGSQATTPFQLRGMLADDLQSGVFQTATVRPSLATSPQATVLTGAAVVPAWICGRV